jgi:hypothetical protein
MQHAGSLSTAAARAVCKGGWHGPQCFLRVLKSILSFYLSALILFQPSMAADRDFLIRISNFFINIFCF